MQKLAEYNGYANYPTYGAMVWLVSDPDLKDQVEDLLRYYNKYAPDATEEALEDLFMQAVKNIQWNQVVQALLDEE